VGWDQRQQAGKAGRKYVGNCRGDKRARTEDVSERVGHEADWLKEVIVRKVW
jgi:hypothetical protein